MIELSKCCNWPTRMVTDVGVSEITICEKCGNNIGPNGSYSVTPPQGGQPAKCPECGSNMTRFGSSDMCSPETITFFNECRRCKKVYPVVQPAEPVEGATALEALITFVQVTNHNSYTKELISAARQEASDRQEEIDALSAQNYTMHGRLLELEPEAANRRPSTGEDDHGNKGS